MFKIRTWLAGLLIGKISFIKNVDFDNGVVKPRHDKHFYFVDCNSDGTTFLFTTENLADEVFDVVVNMGEGNTRLKTK